MILKGERIKINMENDYKNKCKVLEANSKHQHAS